MNSKRSNEGYLLIDHRDSPGVPDEIMVAQGLPAGSGKKVFECATYTCNHCERVVVAYRESGSGNEPGYCPKCDHYVCKTCEAARVASGGACYPFKAMIQDMLEFIDGGKPPVKQALDSEVFQSRLLI